MIGNKKAFKEDFNRDHYLMDENDDFYGPQNIQNITGSDYAAVIVEYSKDDEPINIIADQ